MRSQRKVSSVFDYIVNLFAISAGVIITFTLLLVNLGVVARYIFHSAIIWEQEITEYSLLWITFLATTWLLREEKHVVIDLVVNRLSPRIQTSLGLINSILGTGMSLVLTWYGLKVTWENFLIGFRFTTQLETPKFIVLAIIPIGSSLLFIQFLRRTYRYLRPRKESSSNERQSLK